MKEKLDIKARLNIQKVNDTELALSEIYEKIGNIIIKNRENKVRIVKIRVRVR